MDLVMLKYAAEAPRPVAPRTYRFVASTSARDRDGDVIPVEAWDLTSFSRNPVILTGHDRSKLPVAKGRAWVEGNRLLVDVTFPPAGASSASDEAHDLVAGGFVRAVSVGFRALEPATPLDDGRGYRFARVELLEISLVSVPAHQDALAAALGGKAGRMVHVIAEEPPRFLVTKELLASAVPRAVARIIEPLLRQKVAEAAGCLDWPAFLAQQERRKAAAVSVPFFATGGSSLDADRPQASLGPSFHERVDGGMAAARDLTAERRALDAMREGTALLRGELGL